MRILHNHTVFFHQYTDIYTVIDFMYFTLTQEQIRSIKHAPCQFLGFIFEFQRKKTFLN